VGRPLNLTPDEIEALPRQEVTCTVECSGNDGIPWLTWHASLTTSKAA
jgi:DMSO/TMAO reductase YedYZ molybdopterin-dependent catalytic subunit